MQSLDLYASVGMVEMGADILTVAADHKPPSLEVAKFEFVPDVFMRLVGAGVVHVRSWVEEGLTRVADSEERRVSLGVVFPHLKGSVVADVAFLEGDCFYLFIRESLLHALYRVFVV